MSLSLYDIGQELKTLQQQLEEELTHNGGDVSDGTEAAAIENLIAGYEWKQREKVDAYVNLIRNFEADEAKCNEAAAHLESRARKIHRQIDRLKAFAKSALEAQGLDKATGILHGGLRIQQNAAVPLEILEHNPEKWPTFYLRVVKEIDKRKVADDLKAGSSTLDGFAKLGAPGTHLRVM